MHIEGLSLFYPSTMWVLGRNVGQQIWQQTSLPSEHLPGQKPSNLTVERHRVRNSSTKADSATGKSH